MLMRHVAVLLGPEKHRGIIAFISEQLDNTAQPENLLFAEAVRYTSALVSCFDLSGKRLFENPAFTACYGNDKTPAELKDYNDFTYRFFNDEQANYRLEQALKKEDCLAEHLMKTKQGIRRHKVDVRTSRHPLTGDYVFLVTEYDVTELHDTIAELKKTKETLKKLAHYDPLTTLPTVWLTKERLKTALLRAKRDATSVGVVFIDLDGFKQVNDSLGHGAGDELLTLVAQRLKATFRESDTVGRIGGDEFLVCLPDLTHRDDAVRLADKAIAEIARQYHVKDDTEQVHAVQVSASIGVAFYPSDGIDAESLLRVADNKMYQAKKLGKNQYVA